MSAERRDYDKELTDLLRIAKDDSCLTPSSFTNYAELVQTPPPVAYWIDTQTPGQEVENANT